MPDQYSKIKPNFAVSKLPKLGMSPKHLLHDFKRYYGYRLGRDENCQSLDYAYEALALAVSDRLTERWKKTYNAYKETDCKRAHYLSMEFLLGRTLSNAMLSLGITNAVESAMYELGLELEQLIENEPDAGLGNGGLGRLAACFIDSCATLQLPVTGYGLRYEYGVIVRVVA